MRYRLLSILTMLMLALVAFIACGRGEPGYDGCAVTGAPGEYEPAREEPVAGNGSDADIEIHTHTGTVAPPSASVGPRRPEPIGEPPRYGGVAMYEFIPGNHGAILPFLGGAEISDWGASELLYGFINEAGEVVVEPVFRDVRKLEYGGSHVFVVSKLLPVRWITGVIGGNGSFIEWFDQVYIPQSEEMPQPPLIPVRTGRRWGAIDFYGELVIPLEHPNAPIFSEGLAAVFTPAGHELIYFYTYYGEPFYYINMQNEKILGPFEPPRYREFLPYHVQHLQMMAFQDGLAMNFRDGVYGFINKTGEVVIPHRFWLMSEWLQSRWNDEGYAVVALYDKEPIANGWEACCYMVVYGLIDRDGEIVAQAPPTRTYDVEESFGLYMFRDQAHELVAAFDLRGTPVEPPGSFYLGGGYFESFQYGGISISGNGVNRLLRRAGHIRANLLFDSWFTIASDSSAFLWNAQTERVKWEMPGNFWLSYLDDLGIFLVGQVQSDRSIRSGFMTLDGNVIMDFEFEWLQRIGGNFLAAKGQYGGLISPDGQWIVRTRLREITEEAMAEDSDGPFFIALEAQLLPPNDVYKDDEFIEMYGRFTAAVRDRDIQALSGFICEQIRFDFGSDPGMEYFFYERGLRDNPEESGIWDELDEIIRLGGYFRYDDFIAPYTFASHLAEFDGFSYFFITHGDVPVFAEQDTHADIIGSLSYNVMRISAWDSDFWRFGDIWSKTGEDFVWIQMPSEEAGYIQRMHLRSPTAHRLSLSRNSEGDWKMVFLIAGG